ncbi:MAG: peptidase M24 [Oceanospirillaceae bacterium]|nr:peptidase M24 [Oceanospirillaceae bacterium]HCI03106.1 peptidase M24 [Oceanospirillaceae bacterium]|tara:strand:+ start:1994 stop:3319 length:1326 start_codon:yes stop_codon:yes gene_type:complete
MTSYRDQRKIDPTRGQYFADSLANDNDRMEIGPTTLAYAEWEAAGITLPNLSAMREYRWQRLVSHINARDYGAILLFDPLNIRYGSDSTNMQLWNTHNPFRCLVVCADGYMVMYDYAVAKFLSTMNPLVNEQRDGADFFYFDRGDKIADAAEKFAKQIADLVQQHGEGNQRIGVDKPMLHAIWALENNGFTIFPGEELTEKARAIKSIDEINAMRCAIYACEQSVEAMALAAKPGLSENEIWAVLHAENIKRGGEWIETRLLASGPRTNPWFQESGPRIVQNNEILSFDTDMIGPYGICADLSRSWWIGDGLPRPDMVYAMQHAYEHIQQNMALLKPGVSLRELSARGHRLDAQYEAGKYGCMMHGVGLCDEWPLVAYDDKVVEGAFDYVLEPGMCLCVEALVAPDGGDFAIKLEDQVVITEDGYENLTKLAFDAKLMGES